MCGIAGIKPTFGRVSNFGVVPLSWSQDHCGPMTWTVTDCAIMLQAIAGHDPKDPTTADVPVPDYLAALRDGARGLTVGVPREYFYEEAPGVDVQVIQAAERALENAVRARRGNSGRGDSSHQVRPGPPIKSL